MVDSVFIDGLNSVAIDNPMSMSIKLPANTTMELHTYAEKPISRPVIPSLTTSIAYPIVLIYESSGLSIILYINTATKAERPILTRLGTAESPKNGAMYINEAILTSIRRKYSKSAIEKE